VVVDHLPRSAWFSRYVVKRLRWHGQMDDPDFVSFLLHMGKQHHLERWVLFPMQDEAVQLVACNAQQLARIYTLVTQEWDIVQWANDKRMTYRMARETGVPFPQTFYPAGEDDLVEMAIAFPAIIKPAISTRMQYSLHLKALSVQSRQELVAQYRRALAVIRPDEVMVQEIIPGAGRSQYSCAAYCKEGRMLASMTARRTRQYPIDYGLGSSFVEAVPVPALLEATQRLLDYMQVTGMVEVEYKFDERDQCYKLLDINLRPWGWHTLCVACGLDFPYMQYCDALGIDHGPILTPHYDHHWVRLLTDIPAGLQEMRAGLSTPQRYVRSLLGKTEFSVLDWRDPLPALGDFMVALSRVLKKPASGSHT
jgi:predicted ATP-grasp superfamily ATP-dependent carboligase